MILNNVIKLYYAHKEYLYTFAIAGIATGLIYFTLFALFWRILHYNHIVAVSISYTIAAAFHFWFNRDITFKVKKYKNIKQIVKYIALLIINYLITVIILQISLLYTTFPYMGLIIAAGATAVTGYILSKFWIFKVVISS